MTGNERIATASSTAADSCPKLRTWDGCAGRHEAHSPLARLDSKIVFGDDYPEPIRYDAEQKLLRYRGFMSHASYVKLAALSDDRDYQTALERLFVATSPTAVAPQWELPWKGIAAAAAVVLGLAIGWVAWNARSSRHEVLKPPNSHLATHGKGAASDEHDAPLPGQTHTRPAGEARHPVER